MADELNHDLNDLLAWRERFVEQKIRPMLQSRAQALVERHQVLRTHIVQDEATGTPMQRVRPMSEVSVSLEVTVVDETTEEQEEKMKKADMDDNSKTPKKGPFSPK